MSELTQPQIESIAEFIKQFGAEALTDAYLTGVDILENKEKVREAETSDTHPSFKFGNINHE